MKLSNGKKIILLITGILFIGIILILGFWYYTPQYLPAPFKKSEQTPANPYEYYIIKDEATDNILMYVSVVKVSVGDELLMDTGKWYRVMRVEENIAYARQFEKEIGNKISP